MLNTFYDIKTRSLSNDRHESPPLAPKAFERFRSIPNILPFFIHIKGEIHHPPRYDGRRSFLGFGTLPSPDAEAERIFHNLVRRNAINLGSVRTESRVFYEGMEEAGIAGPVREVLQSAKETL